MPFKSQTSPSVGTANTLEKKERSSEIFVEYQKSDHLRGVALTSNIPII